MLILKPGLNLLTIVLNRTMANTIKLEIISESGKTDALLNWPF